MMPSGDISNILFSVGYHYLVEILYITSHVFDCEIKQTRAILIDSMPIVTKNKLTTTNHFRQTVS